jgi:CO/xanthine dehydrogenase Mo-binding subunit
MSMPLFSEPTARAAAALREAMRDRAAEGAGADPREVEDANGGFRLPGGARVTYADLSAGAAVVLEAGSVPEAPLYSFDPSRRHRQIGRDAAPLQAKEIVTGAPLFTADVRLEDMLFGRMLRPPARNAKLAAVDAVRVRQIPGVVDVVIDREQDFAGVVCETPSSVDAAIEAIDVSWELPAPFDQGTIDALVDVDKALARGDLEHAPSNDCVDSEPAWDVDLRFDLQIQSHATQEPRAAVARVVKKNGSESPMSAEIWTGSQDAFLVHRHAAHDLGISEDNVTVHTQRLGGGFGGREHYDAERDAVRLSRAVGRPVKVQWSREDEFRSARNRPPSTHRIRLRADEGGRLAQWWHAFLSGYIIFARGRMPDRLLSAARLMGDIGVSRGSLPPYAAERTRVEFEDVDLPIDLGTWRSLGAAPNAFVIESAVDELARHQKIDPVEFRLRNLAPENERLGVCLRRVRELAEKVDLSAGIGRGYACGVYEEKSFVAGSADVVVEPSTGTVRVLRMCCVQDVGLAINPGQLRAQIEGNLIWGLGMALVERVEIGESDITSLNFDSYPIPRMPDAPEFDIEIISPRDVRPAGAGEAAMIVGPAAIANAVRDATGRRYTSLPIRSAITAPESKTRS